jgi:hypothetical protein
MSDNREGVIAFNIPPLMLVTTSALCILNGIRLAEPIAREIMFRCARFVVEILECDAAAANILVMKRMLASKATNSIIFGIICFIHALALVTGSLLVGAGNGKCLMVNSLYCISMLFRSSGVYINFLEGLEDVVAAFLDIRPGVPDPSCKRYAESVLLLIGWDLGDPDVQSLHLLLNGPWWDHDHIIVYGRCGSNFHDVVREVTLILYRTIFSSLPDVPMPSRWTKVFESLKSYVPSFAIHGIFVKLYRWTFDKSFKALFRGFGALALAGPIVPEPEQVLPLPDLAADGDAAAAPLGGSELLDALVGVDGSFQEFKQKLGARRGKGLTYVIDNRSCDEVQLHGLTIAPLHYVLTSFLKVAGIRGQHPLGADIPVLLLDVTHLPVSPTLVARQYYGRILQSGFEDSTLNILPHIRNHGGLTEWLLQDIWRTVLRADARLWLAFEFTLNQWPHKLLLTGDDRRHDQAEIAREFVSANLCCVDPFASEPIRRMVGENATSAVFLSGMWQRRLRGIVHEIDGYISDLENRHKRTRDDIINGDGPDAMVAKYVLCEQKTLGVAYTARLNVDGHTAAAATESQHSTMPKRKWGGKFMYHLERCRSEGVCIASGPSWQATHSTWDSLVPEKRDLYDRMASFANDGADIELSDNDSDDLCDGEPEDVIPLPWHPEPRGTVCGRNDSLWKFLHGFPFFCTPFLRIPMGGLFYDVISL